MGNYTALDNPIVDNYIENHLNQIVSAITAQTTPQSIILYGSTARGEASVMVEGERVHMLSDYEISVVGRFPGLRRLCATLSHQMTSRLGVSTGINWMYPSRLQTNQTKNLAFGQGSASIFMYELNSAGQTLYGQDLLKSSPPIDPDEIPLGAGIQLILNRMAEALDYLPCSTTNKNHSRLDIVTWINKTVLACADALLLSAKCYHYSYQERGKRFAVIARDRFAPLIAKAPTSPELVERAVEFKLRPDPGLYPKNLSAVWSEVAVLGDVAFRYLIEQQNNRNFDSYAEFPAISLAHSQTQRNQRRYRIGPIISLLRRKLIEGAKHLDQKHWPPQIFFTAYNPSQVVYTLVPLLFQSCFSNDREMILSEVRQWLGLLAKLPPPSPDANIEWNYLRQQLLRNWKVFCY